jgi:hypothetical protein
MGRKNLKGNWFGEIDKFLEQKQTIIAIIY